MNSSLQLKKILHSQMILPMRWVHITYYILFYCIVLSIHYWPSNWPFIVYYYLSTFITSSQWMTLTFLTFKSYHHIPYLTDKTTTRLFLQLYQSHSIHYDYTTQLHYYYDNSVRRQRIDFFVTNNGWYLPAPIMSLDDIYQHPCHCSWIITSP